MGATAPELARGGPPAEDARVGDARESPVWLAGKGLQAVSEPTAGGMGGVRPRAYCGEQPEAGGRGSAAAIPARQSVPPGPWGRR